MFFILDLFSVCGVFFSCFVSLSVGWWIESYSRIYKKYRKALKLVNVIREMCVVFGMCLDFDRFFFFSFENYINSLGVDTL